MQSSENSQRFLAVRPELCQKTREKMDKLGFLDTTLKYVKLDGDKIGLPITKEVSNDDLIKAFPSGEVICDDSKSDAKSTPATPYDELLAVCKSKVSASRNFDISDVPKHWEKHGDMILFPKDSFSTDGLWSRLEPDFWSSVATVLKAKRLAKKAGKISDDDFRTPKVAMILGSDTWASRTENGIFYTWDISKSMFSVGNITEKQRLSRLDCRGQVIVDLFAGIGYFTLTYLVHARADYVYACEWNPYAVQALKINLAKNNVENKCTILEGDNRLKCPVNVADHVNLGLIPSSAMSYEVGCRALKQETGGILHIHGNVRTKSGQDQESSWASWCQDTIDEIQKILGAKWQLEQVHLERVKSFAPKVHHLVLDLKCSPLKKM